MGQREIAQGNSCWYLIDCHGDMAVRVCPGMRLGETATGELSFDPSYAQLELDIADDGGLVLSAVDDLELESAGGIRCRRERLTRDHRAEIHLPHNVLQLATDFSELARADDTVEIRAVRPTEEITEPQTGRFSEGVPEDPDDARVAFGGTSAPDTSLLEPKHGFLLPRQAPRQPGPNAQTVGDGLAGRRTKPTGARRQRILSLSMAALIGLFALLYPALREIRAPAPSATVGAGQVPQIAPAQAPSAVTESSGSGADALPSAVLFPPETVLLPALDAPSATEPDSREEVAERSHERLPEPEPVAAPTIEPVLLLLPERRSIPQIAPTVEYAEAAVGPETIDSQPDSGEEVAERSHERLPEPEPVAAPAIEPVLLPPAELARRDLLAADLALAQGRLTTPPEASAYTLYNRVLALDPGSPEARRGLQSVRRGLINRALAQLANDALDDSRQSLQAAAEAGANPQLVADLRGEVDYRQRLINARAGRFETLYPVDQLVAVSQEPPRRARYASTGAEVSVEVQFTVTASGDVRDVAVLDDPPKNLERALRRAVREWRFEPVLYNGRPMPVRSSVRFTFPN